VGEHIPRGRACPCKGPVAEGMIYLALARGRPVWLEHRDHGREQDELRLEGWQRPDHPGP